MDPDDPRSRLFDLARHGVKPGLDRIAALLEALDVDLGDGGAQGDDAPDLVVTVAGTNGKGTVAALLADALTEAGRRTGRFLSPHVLEFGERIAVDGAGIPGETVDAFAARLDDLVAAADLADDPPTFFEAVTALALAHFRDEACDAWVLEVGLGGRLDATNAVDADVCVVTNVGRDHLGVLGPTVEDVAREKAGILREATPCVTGATGRARAVLWDRAARLRAPFVVPDPSRVRVEERSLDGWTLALDDVAHATRLHGDHQADNLLLARAALEAAADQDLLDAPAVPDALRAAADRVHLPGRFDVLDASDPTAPVVADGAHNPEAAEALARTWKALELAPATVVLGVLADKEVDAVLRALDPVTAHLVATAPAQDRALAAEDLADRARAAGLAADVQVRPHVADAVDHALARDPAGPVLVTGSLFTAGEAIRHRTGREGDPTVAR